MRNFSFTSPLPPLLIALLLLSACTETSAQTCTSTSLATLITVGEASGQELLTSYKVFFEYTKRLEEIADTLDNTCDELEEKQMQAEAFNAVLKTLSKVPPLKNYINPLSKTLDTLDNKVLTPPLEPVCNTSLVFTATVVTLKASLTAGYESLDAFVSSTMGSFSAVRAAVAAYDAAGGLFGAQCTNLNNVCAATTAVTNVFNDITTELNNIRAELEAIERDLEKVDDFVVKIFNPIKALWNSALGKIIDGVMTLLNTKISFPWIGGSKDRGIGEIPKCCPSNYNNIAGLCYKKCKSGYKGVLTVCWEKCPSGYKDLGLTCVKAWVETKKVKIKVGPFKKTIKVPVPRTKTTVKKSYPRGGRLPATFGKDACACVSKKSLEAGLCYHKCGSGRFSGYGTRLLTACIDVRTVKVKLMDLTKYLKIFEKIDDIPGLGDALKFINNIVSKAFSKLTNMIKKLGIFPKLKLGFKFQTPRLPSLSNLLDLLKRSINLPTDLLNFASVLKNLPTCQ